MNYTVRWTKAALGHLALIWTSSANRGLVTSAQAEIDRRLRDDALRHGTHRSAGLYVIQEFPLRALFEVDADTHVVWVVSLNWLR